MRCLPEIKVVDGKGNMGKRIPCVHINSAENKNNPPQAKRRQGRDGKRSRNRGRTLGGQNRFGAKEVDYGQEQGRKS